MKPAMDILDWARAVMGRRPEPGAAPGTIIADPGAHETHVTMIRYDRERMEEQAVDDPGAVAAALETWPVTWINVEGLGDVDTLHRVGEIFGLHPLALEDLVHLNQSPKVDQYGNQLFIVARMASAEERVETEQVSMFLGERFILTFQERRGDCWDPVRERIRKSVGRIRRSGPDYLAYALLDAVVDHYFPVLERYVERAESLEDRVIEAPAEEHVGQILDLKHEIVGIRRNVWPLREVIRSLMREELPHIKKETRLFLRDCHDHTQQLLDILDSYREIGAALMDAYLSSVGNRTNEVMKVLTIIATIFIPLTFIAGIYGMNFDRKASVWSMPELGWAWGYPACLGLMLAVTLGLIVYFARKGWLGGRRR